MSALSAGGMASIQLLSPLLFRLSTTSVSLLGDNQTVLSVSRRNRREARASLLLCSGCILVLFNALMVAILSMPAADSMRQKSRRLFPALLHSANCVPCLISSSHQLSGPSSRPKENIPSRVDRPSPCQCVISVDLWHCSDVPAFTHLAHVSKRRLSNNTLTGQPWTLPFEAANSFPTWPAQIAVHAT